LIVTGVLAQQASPCACGNRRVRGHHVLMNEWFLA
jgi:hypothetical protein